MDGGVGWGGAGRPTPGLPRYSGMSAGLGLICTGSNHISKSKIYHILERVQYLCQHFILTRRKKPYRALSFSVTGCQISQHLFKFVHNSANCLVNLVQDLSSNLLFVNHRIVLYKSDAMQGWCQIIIPMWCEDDVNQHFIVWTGWLVLTMYYFDYGFIYVSKTCPYIYRQVYMKLSPGRGGGVNRDIAGAGGGVLSTFYVMIVTSDKGSGIAI